MSDYVNKAGLHVDTIPWMHERRIAAFLPDGDGEAAGHGEGVREAARLLPLAPVAAEEQLASVVDCLLSGQILDGGVNCRRGEVDEVCNFVSIHGISLGCTHTIARYIDVVKGLGQVFQE